MKLCLTLMITSVLEVHRGVANLWKQGSSGGMKGYPNYGQYIPVEYFKAFLKGFPFIFSDRKYWDVAPRDLPFNFVQPFIDKYNGLRVKILKMFYLVLDKSMPGWCPKTSKQGGLPHISFKARKRVPLGTMF